MLGEIEKKKILVVGDFFLDRYLKGNVERISPEAPVPVLEVEEEWFRPGGAGNVALNLHAMGADVTVIGRVGADWEGDKLLSLLEEKGMDSSKMIRQQDYVTGVKTRLISGNQQMLRIDREWKDPVLFDLSILRYAIEETDLVVISDYGKGFLSQELLFTLFSIGKLYDKQVIVDPKGKDFSRYRGATLIKPNKKEAYAAAGAALTDPIDSVGQILLEKTEAQAILITRSEEGMTLYTKSKRLDAPVVIKDIIDVTGAGDTVVAMIAIALANQIEIGKAMALANVAASIAIEHIGCYAVSLHDVAKRLLTPIYSNGVIQFQDLSLFKMEVPRGCGRLVAIDPIAALSLEVYAKLDQLQSRQEPLVVSIPASHATHEMVSLLKRVMPHAYFLDQDVAEALLSENYFLNAAILSSSGG